MEQRNAILMVMTSHDHLDRTNNKTGVWLGQMTDSYYELEDAGCAVILCSPRGGLPPVDPISQLTAHITLSTRRFIADEKAQKYFHNTLPLENVKASAFDAVFIVGGHGALWDLARHPQMGRLLCEFVDEQKPIAAVCHGAAALFTLEDCRPGFLNGRELTSFTDAEEGLIMRKNYLPYSMETKLKESAVLFSKATVPFMEHVVLDENLITGQNPLSASLVAKTLIELIYFPKTL